MEEKAKEEKEILESLQQISMPLLSNLEKVEGIRYTEPMPSRCDFFI